MPVTINFIGCGRLGKTIAALFRMKNAAQIGAILNSSFESGTRAAKFVAQGNVAKTIKELPPADVYFITTPDNAIQTICEQMVKEQVLKPCAIIVHCSGALSSDELSTAKELGCFVASIHPIKSFANPDNSIHSFNGTYCAIEGDQQATSMLRKLFQDIGGIVFDIKKEHKKRYHAASVIANNYLVTLHHHAVECYQSAGIQEDNAKQIVSMLMNDALSNIKNMSYQQALTGPINRGDTQTVCSHLKALETTPSLHDFYSYLGRQTLPLTTHSQKKTRGV